MRIVNVRNCAIAVLAGVVLCVCCALRGNDGTVGLSSRSVHLRLGSDTAVVTVRHAGWAIDSIRIYEDVAGSRLLDKTFCFSEKEKKRMRRGRPVERRYGWLNVKTGKNAITLVAVDTRLIVNKRCAVLYLHRRECHDSIRVEHEGHRFMAESAASARMQVFKAKAASGRCLLHTGSRFLSVFSLLMLQEDSGRTCCRPECLPKREGTIATGRLS